MIDDARAIYRAAVQGVQADVLLANIDWERTIERPFNAYRHINVVGLGKASMAMAWVIETQLGTALNNGCVVVPHGYSDTLPFPFKRPKKISVLEAGHPVPDESSEEAAAVLLEIAEQSTEEDLLVVLISGGGSALTTHFAPGITLDEGQQVAKQLLRCGADIRAMNTVRKHLSIMGGGRLARAAAPAEVVALVVSDVVGDDLSVIASGPTVGDPTRVDDAIRVLRDYDLWDRMPLSVVDHLQKSRLERLLETPKPDDKLFERVKTLLIGSNKIALQAACREATRRSYEVEIKDVWIEGEAREAGVHLVEALRSAEAKKPICWLWGGETTVTVKGKGIGGRNQELALSAAQALSGETHPMLLLSGGTDGIDGPTDAAGAWVTPHTMEKARQRKRDPQAYLDANDAHTFFLEMNTLLKPGPTHTNVMDVMIGLVG